MARKKGYGQFCPVAQAAEIVAERWTLLILRELICGSRRFNDLRRGVPLMSPTLLSQRLKELERAGVVARVPAGSASEYQVTRAGAELRPIIELLGLWGQRWVRRDVRDDELDPALLMWDIRRCADTTALPAGGRTTFEFEIQGVPEATSKWWLVSDRGELDLCLEHPGYDVDLYVSAHVRTLTEVWLGRTPLADALSQETLRIEGQRAMLRAFREWFRLSTFARLARAVEVGDVPDLLSDAAT